MHKRRPYDLTLRAQHRLNKPTIHRGAWSRVKTVNRGAALRPQDSNL
jgi:hypothetical protein